MEKREGNPTINTDVCVLLFSEVFFVVFGREAVNYSS